MKKIVLIIILIHYCIISISQIFPEPTGMAATDPDKVKTIGKCNSWTASGAQAPKTNTIARRYSFGIGIWNELYQVKGKKWDICWPNWNCTSCSNCDVGWNKIGRITFVRHTNTNNNKLHVGWRADPNNDHQLKMSAYFHEVDWGEKNYPDYFVSHYITNVHTDTEPYIDMYMSRGTIAMIVNSDAVVIRKPGMIPDNKNTFLTRSFYFGDFMDCVSKHKMKIDFRNQHYDWSGFPEKLNTCKYITVNISEFESGDEHTFYAYEEIYGSISDTKAITDVQYEKGHPNPVKQKCIISGGADITFSAGGKVILNHGFHAKPGSHFVAKIIKKKKYPGYDDEPKRLNLPPLDQSEPCNKFADSLYFAQEAYNDIANNGKIYSNNQENFRIYPNPSPGIFNIELYEEGISNFTVEVTDMMGTMVFYKDNIQTGKTKIDITDSAKGIYFVKIQAGDRVWLEKVVYR
ncbi:MAG: hypothetical protein B6D61_07935 [Bacteroidetes bacterium 4484_249]|nr:MAG: hypothetical protein B6D61_07935 [Bacteroidetes bacterium 4484_249]